VNSAEGGSEFDDFRQEIIELETENNVNGVDSQDVEIHSEDEKDDELIEENDHFPGPAEEIDDSFAL